MKFPVFVYFEFEWEFQIISQRRQFDFINRDLFCHKILRVFGKFVYNLTPAGMTSLFKAYNSSNNGYNNDRRFARNHVQRTNYLNMFIDESFTFNLFKMSQLKTAISPSFLKQKLARNIFL